MYFILITLCGRRLGAGAGVLLRDGAEFQTFGSLAEELGVLFPEPCVHR